MQLRSWTRQWLVRSRLAENGKGIRASGFIEHLLCDRCAGRWFVRHTPFDFRAHHSRRRCSIWVSRENHARTVLGNSCILFRVGVKLFPAEAREA